MALLCLPDCSAPNPGPATKPSKHEWLFHFNPADFRMTVRFHGPDPHGEYYSFTAGSSSHEKRLQERAEEPRHITFTATEKEIRNWRSAMHPPTWKGGPVTPGVFNPKQGYTGYVVEIETDGRPMFAKLGWDLETYDALSTLEGCSGGLEAMLEALARKREEWARARFNILASGEWHKVVVGAGSGSCWGEETSPELEAVRDGKSILIRKPGKINGAVNVLSTDSEEAQRFRRQLYAFALHYELEGKPTPNSFLVYRIQIQKSPKDELATIFYGYGSHSDEQATRFKDWMVGWPVGVNPDWNPGPK